MNGKLYIKKFIRDDGETLSFDAEEIYLSENNTLLVRSDPATTAVEFTEEDGGEMIRQRGATYSQPVSGLIVPKSTEYWALCVRLSRFFILNHTYKIVYIKRDGSMFSMNRAWINAGLQIVPVPYENYSTWTIEFRIGDNFWTEYAEDSQGKEIYSNSVELPLLTAGTGGEVWNDVTQQTLSGLGNYFTIDGTSISANINELELRGDTFQQSYSGKNLWPIPKENQTVGQVTYTYNQDGTFSLSGDPTGVGAVRVIVPLASSGITPGQTYTIWTDHGIGWGENQVMYYIQSCKADGTWVANIATFTSSAMTQTVANTDEQYIMFVLSWSAKGNYTNFNNVKTQLVAGSTTDSDFEPYTGGIPAPSPGYPQDIQVVTGEQTVEVTGKNIVNLQGYSSSGVTGSINGDGSITISGTATSSGGVLVMRSQQPLRAGTYTMTISKPLPFLINFSIASGVSFRIPAGGTSVTTTLPEDYIDQGGLYMALTAGTAYNETFNLQVVAGSTPDYDFEPYQGQSYKINLGKNIWSSSMEVGGISANGTSLSNNKRVRSATKVVVRPGATYTLSAIPRDSGKVINVAIQGWTSDGTFLSQITGADWQTLPLTFTTPANCYKVTLNGRYSDDTVFGTVGESTDAFQNVQLEAGANATEYAQYFPPVELCRIGDYQDYIYKSGSDWHLHKETKKAIFNGSENWAYNSEVNRERVFVTVNDIALQEYVTTAPVVTVCDQFRGSNWFNLYRGTAGVNVMSSHDSNHRIIIRTNDFTSADSFKTWLSSHNMTVYYVLATSTDTRIIDATLVAQLNALAGAQAYSGKTVYQTNSATMPAILSVELLQSVGGGEIWDNVGAVWEEGVGGVQTINVETTQTTYPVWTVTGPCSNPTLQNDTTDTIASFDGMIASGQTLTVNFADNTAYLDSAPVAKYVSGYVSLAPGENVIGFNSDGGSTQTSTISWDNIIN